MIGLTQLRSMFGLVGQEPVLFDTTVKENILLGKQDTKTEEDQEVPAPVVRAAKKANAHEFVSNMPERYDTNVGKCTISLYNQHIICDYFMIYVFRKSIRIGITFFFLCR